jgi:hypothetical protein
MTTAELEARAHQRAKDQHVRIFKTDRPGVYTTKSKSNPNERYTLVSIDGTTACSCKGFGYRKSCKHVEQLKDRLARDAKRNPVESLPTTMPAEVQPFMSLVTTIA